MLLQRLVEYADRLSLPPTLYAETPIRYIIELDAKGRLLNPRPTDTANPSNPRTKRGTRRAAPEVQRSSSIRPLLLADKADYVLGYVGNDGKRERAAAAHAAFLQQVERCVEATKHPAVAAILNFLRSDPLAQLDLGSDFAPGDKLTFRVAGVLPIDVLQVQEFWATANSAESDVDVRRMQCVVCGKERPVLQRLQAKIKGVPGGQTSGTALISANAEAFESYGLPASLVAPTCASCGERFTKSLNALLADDSARIVIGNAAFVFWTREPTDFSFRALLTDPQPEDVKALLESFRSGRPPPELASSRFYATALSGSGGRVVVRDWIDTTVDEAQRHLAHWFLRQQIVDPYEETARPLGLYALAAATVRDVRKDLPPTTPRALLRSALAGTPLSDSLLYQAVRRNRAEQKVTRPRAALIKLVLVGAASEAKEDWMVELDIEQRDSAYLCGRLLAVLEAVQRAAVPGAKATVVDRFFGTASSAPASVFGRLVRGAQPHLAKLERDRPPAYVALQRRLEEILSGIQEFPRTLALEQQGLFALGYYHQRAFDRAQARQAGERRKTGGEEPLPVLPVDVMEEDEGKEK